ncbi:permease-like cell division protein FtsX [Gilvimarinus agarilyticus]|uniref:permease-like cell division protein FtsX n=1 Tax=unclassified Gilvimarinus TaxID=2642066 RepID=UPI001C093CCC|nr:MULTISPECIES: permease-like cell division protein FtsX [unclassified Gilvimarinus]MBU2884410.1 permease-like cell division protein FtsX [Gilvimarinus agarilyticus]MDO6569546.1 permease-like cell division protein FtsX [Gilvimarinus sp. 2_MG-2023]MDO6748129.1 permease-like cell division protein FtsX [Gilvimarinus sp. 1_MG-2023]
MARPNQVPARPKGAIHSKTQWRDRLEAWQAHHSTCAIESLIRLTRSPLQSLLTWLVVAIATALPATLYVALQNVQALGYNWQDSSQISVFIKRQTAPEAIERWRTELSQQAGIEQVDYISPSDALAEFRQHSGLGEVLNDLEENPLPPVLLVQPRAEASQGAALEQLLASLNDHALSDEAKLDMMWVQRLQQLIDLASRGVFFLALLLVLGLLLVIGNTIRLAIENRRDEIVVVKLVGGTDAYVRRPFLYTGLWYGLGGGVIALILLALGLGWLSVPVAKLANLYHSEFHLQGLNFYTSLQLVLLAGLVGLAGAWLAVGRHLRAIKPE